MASKAIHWLIATHVCVAVLLLLVSGTMPPHNRVALIFLTLGFSQASLVGCWAGFSRMHVELRLLVMFVICCILSAMFIPVVRHEMELTYAMWGVTLVNFVGCLAIRGVVLTLVHLDKEQLQQLEPRWQFSIRQLMVFTLIVSCCLAARGWLQSFAFEDSSYGVTLLVFLSFMIILGFVCILATLRLGFPAVRILATLSIAGVLAYVFDHLIPNDRHEVANTLMVGDALFLLSSLIVVRHCGYRLVRHDQRPIEAYELASP